MIYTDPHAAAAAFRAQIDGAERILLLTHVSPDGDAIGSLLGALHSLRAYGKQPIGMIASPVPDYCQNLPGAAELLVYRPGAPLPEADLTWMLDTANLERVGAVFAEHEAALRARPLMVTDHHVTNDGGGLLHLIQPAAASCAELLFALLAAMGLPIPAEAATCMLLGIYTDTQSFQTSGTGPGSLRAAAELLERGAARRQIVEAVYHSVPSGTVRLSALALREMQSEGGLLWATISQAMIQELGDDADAGDDVVGRMQRVAGMRACALFKERPDGTVKISLRSKPGINVAAVAQTWGGGGHAQAAGATLAMGLEAAQAAVLPLLRAALAGAPGPQG